MSLLQLPAKRLHNRDSVAQILRQSIADGTYAPSTRMPTRIDLQQQLQISPMTVQAAFDQLNEQGFIVSKGSHGTFVSDWPPHLSRYCVLFPWKPVYAKWSNYWTAIHDEAIGVSNPAVSASDGPARSRIVSIRYGVSDFESIEDYLSLEAEIREHRLAGLLFVAKPQNLTRLDIWTDPRVSRAVIADRKVDDGRVPAVGTNGTEWMEMAAQRAIDRRCKRVAFLSIDRASQSWLDVGIQLLARAGVEVPSHRVQFTGMSDSRAIRNLTRLLMQGRPSDRPDALIVTDDNLVPDATAALKEMSLDDPDELCVVAHANFPYVTPSHVPASRLGFDVRELVRICFERIDSVREKKSVPPVVRLSPRFDSLSL